MNIEMWRTRKRQSICYLARRTAHSGDCPACIKWSCEMNIEIMRSYYHINQCDGAMETLLLFIIIIIIIMSPLPSSLVTSLFFLVLILNQW